MSRAIITLMDFLQTGRIGPIQLGVPRESLLKRTGKPELQDDRDPVTGKPYWVEWGNVEVTFSRRAPLYEVGLINLNVSIGPERSEVLIGDSMLFRYKGIGRSTTLDEYLALLEELAMPFRLCRELSTDVGTWVQTSPECFASFWHEQGVRSSGTLECMGFSEGYKEYWDNGQCCGRDEVDRWCFDA